MLYLPFKREPLFKNLHGEQLVLGSIILTMAFILEKKAIIML